MDDTYEYGRGCDPNDLKPLEWDDEEIEDDDIVFVDIVYEEEDDEEEEDRGFGGWDDLKPFTSFDDESAWGDML